MKKIQIDQECKFLKDIESSSTAFMGTNRGIYNLLNTIGALKLWTKGIKPSRQFKIRNVKLYFGITGNAETLLYKLETINKIIKGEVWTKNSKLVTTAKNQNTWRNFQSTRKGRMALGIEGKCVTIVIIWPRHYIGRKKAIGL